MQLGRAGGVTSSPGLEHSTLHPAVLGSTMVIINDAGEKFNLFKITILPFQQEF